MGENCIIKHTKNINAFCVMICEFASTIFLNDCFKKTQFAKKKDAPLAAIVCFLKKQGIAGAFYFLDY